MTDDTWNRTAVRRPTLVHGEQVEVMFGSSDWHWPYVGLYTHWTDEQVATGAQRWVAYDQKNDKYYECFGPAEREPEFWIPWPVLPGVSSESRHAKQVA